MHSRIFENTGKKTAMFGFTYEIGNPITVPIVNAAVFYDCEYAGESYVMAICNALYFKNMELNLLPSIIM